MHEVRALTLFALGDYKPAAAALNSFLSSAPGMDWTTMSSLYGNTHDYRPNCASSSSTARRTRQDASAEFVLAYQYLVIGSQDAAVKALQVVVKNQPKDTTPSGCSTPWRRRRNNGPHTDANAGTDAPETDLVGNWRTKAGNTTIDLDDHRRLAIHLEGDPSGQVRRRP